MNQSTTNERTRRRGASWRWLIGVAGLVVFAIVGWWIWLASQSTHAERIAREVPLGTTRAHAETWIKKEYGVLPTYNDLPSANKIVGKTIPERAGAAPEELGGMIYFTVRRTGPMAPVFDWVRYDHLWVYLLLDKNQRVVGYYFLSIDELRQLEQAKIAGDP